MRTATAKRKKQIRCPKKEEEYLKQNIARERNNAQNRYMYNRISNIHADKI